MAIIEDFVESTAGAGVAAGLGAVALAPAILRITGRMLRPVAKMTVQTGIVLYRGTLGPLGAALTDLVSEAQAELDRTVATGAERPAVAATPTSSRQAAKPSRKPPTAPKQKRAPRGRRRKQTEA